MPQGPSTSTSRRRFEFERDTVVFPNELVCEYVFDPAGGRPRMVAKVPRPAYVLRCFVLVRVVRQFFLHAVFDPGQAPLAEGEYRRRVRAVVRRNPRVAGAAERRVVFPGAEGLRSFSRDWAHVLRDECGGAWRSYVLRSHWRMVFPISRGHQERTAAALGARLAEGHLPIVHLVRFPQLTINHGMLVFDVDPGPEATRFRAYDPNDPAGPVHLIYHPRERVFTLPGNRYWPGGRLDVIEIYRNWWF